MKLFVQVFRCNEWRNVTSIAVDASYGGDADRKYDRAYRAAVSELAAWRGYFDDPLRIAEPTVAGGYREARP